MKSDAETRSKPGLLFININYKLSQEKKPADAMEGVDLTQFFVQHAVANTHKEGLEGQQRRIFGRIQRHLEDAIEAGEEFLKLQDAERDFLRKAVEKCLVPAGLSMSFVLFEDEIEAATKKGEAETEKEAPE